MPVGMWVMRTAEFGLVDVLAAGARGAIGVDLAVALVDLDLDAVVDHRIDPDRGEAGVAARVGVERRDAHQAVHARLGLQPAVGVVALDHDRRRLDAGLVAGRLFEHFDVEFAPLAPAHVHAQQHARPVAALGAAGAGMDFDIGIVGRRPRPTAAPRARGARLRSSAPGAAPDPRSRCRRRPPARRARPASSRRRARARSWPARRADPRSIVRSRISCCAASGVVPELGVFGFGVQFGEAARRSIDVKDASSAVPGTA